MREVSVGRMGGRRDERRRRGEEAGEDHNSQSVLTLAAASSGDLDERDSLASREGRVVILKSCMDDAEGWEGGRRR